MVDICEVLEHLIEEFEKIDGKDFKLKYKKVIVPADTTENDMTEVWSSLHWPVDESTSYPDFCPTWQLYEHEEDTEPSFIVHFALSGENVTNGWHILKTPIKDAIGLLRLRRYDPDSIPDSGTFLDNFPRSKKEATDDFHTNIWCEFLLKLSQEDDCPILNKSIKPVPFQELPCKVNVEGLKTDVLTASKLALQYLTKKVEHQKQMRAPNNNRQRNIKTVELVEQIIDMLEHWERKYLPANVQAGRLELAEIVTGEPLKKFIGWLEWHKHQSEVKELKAECTKILRWFHIKNGVLTKNIDDNPFVIDGKAFNLKLKNALLDILGNIRADFTAEKPAEIVQKTKAVKEPEKEAEMPSHYIPCVRIAGIIRKRSDAIARSLTAAKYPVIKKAGKNYCDPEHAAVIWPKWKKYWKEQQENK